LWGERSARTALKKASALTSLREWVQNIQIIEPARVSMAENLPHMYVAESMNQKI
jgi:hypothetical protein